MMNTARDTIADLIRDIRFSGRMITQLRHLEKHEYAEQEIAYRESCLTQLRKCFANRHGMKFDKFGWPECLK